MTAEIEAMLRYSAGGPLGARSFIPAHSSSHRFIQNCQRFENSPRRMIRLASSAMNFLTRKYSGKGWDGVCQGHRSARRAGSCIWSFEE
jgi:hypothetical protein